MSNRKHNSTLLVELLENAPQVALPKKVERKEAEKKVEVPRIKKKRTVKKRKQRRRAKHIALSPGWHCEMRTINANKCIWSVYVTQGDETLESISEYEGSASTSDLIANNKHTYA